MIRGTWVWDRTKRELVPKHLYREEPPKRSDLPCPMLISDTLDYVHNPANGQTYTSKSAYYKAVRAAGCEIVGNETPKAAPRAQMSDPVSDIKQAIEQVKAGHRPSVSRGKQNAA